MPLFAALDQMLTLPCPVRAANKLKPRRSRACPVAPHGFSGSFVGKRRGTQGSPSRFPPLLPLLPWSGQGSAVTVLSGSPSLTLQLTHRRGLRRPVGAGLSPVTFLINPLNPAFMPGSFPNLFGETLWRVPSASPGPLPGIMTSKSMRGSGHVVEVTPEEGQRRFC